MDSPTISSRPDVTVATTTARVTPTPARGAFKQVLAQSLVRGAETAMKVLPGAPLMAVAVRGGSGPGGAFGVPMTGVGSPLRSGNGSAEGPGAGASTRSGSFNSTMQSVGGVAAASATGATGQPGGAGAPGAENGGLESSLQQSQEMNLYYLQIQEAVNSQNRSFTALSNVLKAEHDTVKTAIGNIR
jgi:hypothetical protein